MSRTSATISLPVIDGGSRRSIRRSKNARRRAMVLLLVNIVIAIHIVQWLVTGETVSPIEPAESMRTIEQGQINAGAIFFALAIISTLIFGRFVCGWGCHLMALQDLCGWMMRRVGVRPRAFRSRLMMVLPAGLAVYMFVWPTFERMALAPVLEGVWPTVRSDLRIGAFPAAGFTNHLLTTEFWSSFAGIGVAIPFLLVCGFGCVYLLGSKGFCTYGCPYGAVFGAADRVSTGGITVDPEACDHNGHCTAVCTSNVRVHEEIGAFGRVVDPGCMKCMDCVSVCPTGALSFRLALPPLDRVIRRSGGAVRRWDTSLGEDAALGAVFVGVLMAVRGAYDLVPLLFAVGLAASATFVAWKCWRTVRDANVRMGPVQLVRGGRVRVGGVVLLAIGAIGAAAAAHTGFVNYHSWRAEMLHRRVVIPIDDLLAASPTHVSDKAAATARAALGHERIAERFGLIDAPAWRVRRAYEHLVLGEPDDTERLLRGLVSSSAVTDALVADLGRVIARDGQRGYEAIELYQGVLAGHQSFWRTRERLAMLLLAQGRGGEVVEEARSALVVLDGQPRWRLAAARTRVTLARALGAAGEAEAAIGELERASADVPHDAAIRENLAAALWQLRGDAEGAIRELWLAAGDAPDDADLRFQIGRLELARGNLEHALVAFVEAVEIDGTEARRDAVARELVKAGYAAAARAFTDQSSTE